MMESDVGVFVKLAKEIEARLEDSAGRQDWWKEIETLTLDLQRCWDRLQKRTSEIMCEDFPAFVVFTKIRGFAVSSAVARFEEYREIPRDDALKVVCRFCAFDPFAGTKRSRDLFWSDRSGPSLEATDHDRLDALRFIRQWIRAVSELSLNGVNRPQSDQNTWKAARDQSGTTVSDQMTILFKKDESIVHRTSKDIAAILGCGESAVRQAEAWPFFKLEREKRKQILQESRSSRYRTGKSDDDEMADY